MMLTHTDLLQDPDAFFRELRPTSRSFMPMDAYRRGEDVWVHVDLPGVAEDSLDLNVERNMLTISASRQWKPEDGDQRYLSERPVGAFRRQIFLGDELDIDGIEAHFADGVLTVRIPVSARAKPRTIPIGLGESLTIATEGSSA